MVAHTELHGDHGFCNICGAVTADGGDICVGTARAEYGAHGAKDAGHYYAIQFHTPSDERTL